VGDYALQAAALVGTQGAVIAAEPHPTTFHYLQENVRLNEMRQVSTCNVALSDQPGMVSFSDKPTDDQNAVVESSDIQVRSERLDEIVDVGDNPIALLKVDVEGYERFVLDGAERLLKRTQCIMYESWDVSFEKFDYDSRQMMDWLRERGFQIYKYDRGRTVLVDRSHRSVDNEDLLAISDIDEYRRRMAG
jgi:FkbM family methyltransferase